MRNNKDGEKLKDLKCEHMLNDASDAFTDTKVFSFFCPSNNPKPTEYFTQADIKDKKLTGSKILQLQKCKNILLILLHLAAVISSCSCIFFQL